MDCKPNFANTRCDEYGNQPVPVCNTPPSQPPWFEPPCPPQYKTNYVAFGGIPPAYPCRGELWWNGHFLSIWDGAAWMPVAGGGPTV